jgi:hypothetical protein
MPIIVFRPTRSRLIIQDSKASVLVMKVVVHPDDSVKLVTGDKLEELIGVLRVRERKESDTLNDSGDLGSLVYIAEFGSAIHASVARYQINIAVASSKFDMLVRVALAGKLPTKFFLEAGERISRTGKPGLGYDIRAGKRAKLWDTSGHRTLPVSNFTFILPIDVNESRGDEALVDETKGSTSVATNAQVAELIDELMVFHAETKNTFLSLMLIIGILAVVSLLIGLALLKRT